MGEFTVLAVTVTSRVELVLLFIVHLSYINIFLIARKRFLEKIAGLRFLCHLVGFFIGHWYPEVNVLKK